MSSDVIESKVRSPDGTSIAYDRRGEGPPLVLAGDAVEYFLTTAAMVPPEMVAGMRQAPMWPGFEAVALASVLPRGETRTLPGQTHDVAADALAPVLEELLAAERVGR